MTNSGAAILGRQTASTPGTAPSGQETAIRMPGVGPYLPMREQQRRLADARSRDEVGNLFVPLEHEHVHTNDRGGDRRRLLVDEATLAALGIAYHEVDCGGDITYHGPGLLAGYPIVTLDSPGLSVCSHVRKLEQVIVQTASRFGVTVDIVPSYTGAWVGNEKLTAIGVRVSRGVASRGFALNVCPDLTCLDQIVPRGITNRVVTSLARLTGRSVSVDKVVPVCAGAFDVVFGVELYWCEAPLLLDSLQTAVQHAETATFA